MKAVDRKTEIAGMLGGSFDIESCTLKIGGGELILMYLEGTTDKPLLTEQVLKPLKNADISRLSIESIKKNLLLPFDITTETNMKEAAERIAFGQVVMFLDGQKEFIIFAMRKVASRSVAEPPTSSVLKGPREGFTEDLRTNVSLLRKRLRTPDLRMNMIKTGRYTTTEIIIAYIEGVADLKIVKKIEERIGAINIDGIIDSSYVLKFLEERSVSIFRQVGTSEKPDIVTAKMLEGRIAIIVDGSPIVLTAPFIFLEDLQNSSDYYNRSARASMLRTIRLIGVFLAIILPAAYLAVLEFQYQIMPLKLTLTILTSTAGTPLSPALEMFFVLILFEIIAETGIRMPRYIGSAVALVGAIVLGDTAVKAGILSSPAVLITALSGLGLYLMPDEAGMFSILRILFLGVAAFLGVYGLVISVVALLAYLSSLNIYGAPYLAPVAPFISEDMKDFIPKDEMKSFGKRPKSIPNVNPTRMKTDGGQ